MSHTNRPWPLALRVAALWLVFTAWTSCSGWILSALCQLNGLGYLFALPVLVAGFVVFWRASAGDGTLVFPRLRLRKRPAAIGWLLVVSACLVGGVAYAPSNYDALSYRLPRVLYWWQENRWHWLHHADDRMNYSGTGFEWQMLPLMILQGGDRLLFLLNWVPFLLLPSLCFHGLRAFGVSRASSSLWMWILPLGYGFTLQASSIGNDGIGAILVVAAIAFARLAETRGSQAALILSAIAAASLTSQKLSNLPLLLPISWFWLRAAWGMRRDLPGWRMAAGLAVSVLVSFIPLAILSQVYCGNWAGDPQDSFKLRINKPIPGIAGNAYYSLMGFTDPPLLPVPKPILKKLTAPLNGENSFSSWVQTGFPRFRASTFGEIPTEEGAGIGLGLSILLCVHLLRRRADIRVSGYSWLAISATAVATAAYMAKMGSENTARLTLPYAPLWMACVLAACPRRPPTSPFTRKIFALIPVAFVLPGLVLNPNRPLVPLSLISSIPSLPEGVRSRILDLRKAYASRNDPLADLRKDLPATAREVGFAGGPTQSSYSLFKPFGSRRVVEARRHNAHSFPWLVACPSGILERTGIPWEEWLASSPYTVVSSHPVTFTVQHGSENWFVLRSRNHHPITR